MPGLPDGKPAGMPCPHLTDTRRCALFGRPERPAVCSGLRPERQMCGDTAAHALRWLEDLEAATEPAGPAS